MPKPSPEKLADIILNRRPVYGLDTDSHVRHVANRITARLLFELLGSLDDASPDFASQLSSMLSAFPTQELSTLVGFDTGDVAVSDSDPKCAPRPGHPTEYYLRLVFRDESAAYYQFPLFPHLDADYVLGASRKR